MVENLDQLSLDLKKVIAEVQEEEKNLTEPERLALKEKREAQAELEARTKREVLTIQSKELDVSQADLEKLKITALTMNFLRIMREEPGFSYKDATPAEEK
jgi:hypothetical protein